ncbi:MAG: SIMPL domain-containing protein, partial [Pacificimonas sp.]
MPGNLDGTLLQIEATGMARAAPDLATFGAGITTTGETAKAAIDANSVAAERIRQVIREAGIPGRDVQTRNVSVRPEFERGEGGARTSAPRILGYVATNGLSVRVRDLSKAPDLLQALFDAGANNVNGPRFTIDDDADVLQAARRDAIRNAITEAELYARGFGLRIDRILRVSDSGPMAVTTSDVITVTGNRRAGGPPPPPAPPPVPAPGIAVGEVSRNAKLYV